MCISPANQYIDLREPEETHTMEVTLPQRPSTLCNRVIRCRNFYTDREKLVGKTFPTELTPLRATFIEHSFVLCSRQALRPTHASFSANARVHRTKQAFWFVLQPVSAT